MVNHKNGFVVVIQISTHNIHLYGELLKIILELSSNTGQLMCQINDVKEKSDMGLMCFNANFYMNYPKGPETIKSRQ